MRSLIEARLAARKRETDAVHELLQNVVGPVSNELRAAIEAPGHEAAVLLGLVERGGALHVLLTERSAQLSHHAGQVSLPGGRIDHPQESAIGAALREAREEIGLDPADVDVAGCLETFVTGTGFVVTPVVGFVRGHFEPVLNEAEVSSVFEVPLSELLSPDSFAERHRQRLGSVFRTYEMRYGRYLIWGATAAMLVSFRDLIND